MISQADLDLIVQHLAAASSSTSHGTVGQPISTDDGDSGGDTMSSFSSPQISLILTPPPAAYEARAFTLTGRISPAGYYDLEGESEHYYDGFTAHTDENGVFTVSMLISDDGSTPGNGTSSDQHQVTLDVWPAYEPENRARATTTVTVHNVAPELGIEFRNYALGGPDWDIPGLIHDEGVIYSPDLHKLTVDWGDGSQTVLDNIEGNVEFTEIPGHRYKADGGTYTISVFAEDDDGGMDFAQRTFPMYLLDLDNDANNNDVISALDEPYEDGEPSRYVTVNNDDDNGNGVTDTGDIGPVANENDLEELKLAFTPAMREEVNNYNGWVLVLSMDPTSTGSGELWESEQKGGLPVEFPYDDLLGKYAKTWVIGTDTWPSTLHFEATSAGTVRYQWELWESSFGTVDGDAVVFTAVETPQIDLDADSDNSGVIDSSALEEADEMLSPGKIIHVNTDDDNGNGTPDNQETGRFLDANGVPMIDNDLAPLLITIYDAHQDLTGWSVTILSSTGDVQLWKTQDKVALSPTYIIGSVEVPRLIYVEGISPAQPNVKVTLKTPAGVLVDDDSVLITVVRINAIAYRQQTLPFTPWPVPFQEESTGVGIRQNGDDDNHNQVPDRAERPVSGEDDLIRVELNFEPAGPPPGIALKVARSNTHIQVWEDGEKDSGLLVGVEGGLESLAPMGNTVFVEWSAAQHGASTFEYSVWDSRHNRKAFFDDMTFVPFTSVVVMIGGRDQTAGDPNPFPGQQGIFDLAIDEYRYGGRDVYMYAHDAVHFAGGGPIYDSIVSAINNRGVSRIAVMGYSWGGGGTHDLIAALVNGGDVVAPYKVGFTGYIDGIMHYGFTAEERRPPSSLFHVNQFQRNDATTRGFYSDGDIDLNQSSFGVDHLTIDDNSTILGILQSEYRREVGR